MGLTKATQAAEGKILIVTEFHSREEMDTLFKYSTHAIDYLAGDDVPVSLFISLTTSENLKILQEQNFKVKVIDEDTDLTKYNLLFHWLPNQADKVKSYGQYWQISPHYTLLKLTKGDHFEHEGEAAEFHEIELAGPPIVTPVLRTKTALPTTNPNQTKAETPAQSTPLLPLIVTLSLLIILLAGSLLYFTKFKRSNRV